MTDLVNYISNYVSDPDCKQIVISCILLIFVVFGLQLFGYCFGKR